MDRYLADIRENDTVDPLAFWKERRTSYSKIVPIAEDLISAPASQAFVERIFSVCRILPDGRRNRMKKISGNESVLEIEQSLIHVCSNVKILFTALKLIIIWKTKIRSKIN